jgi:methyl-accepting chemotaxis protein
MKIKGRNKLRGLGLRLSVTTKIAIAFSLLISFLVTAVGTSVVLRDRNLLENEYRDKGWNIIHTALQFNSGYLQNGNHEFMSSLVEILGAYENISYAMILDPGGKILAHNYDNLVGVVLNDEETKSIISAGNETVKIRDGEQDQPALMDFCTPVNLSGVSNGGFIRIGLDISGLNNHVRENMINILIICLLAVLAGIFLAVLISKRMMKKPLLDLTAATEKLAVGDFSYKVPIRSHDELGELAQAFNTMIVHLANLIQSVKSSAVDINKSAEQIMGKLHVSKETNDRLSLTFNGLKQDTAEQVDILRQSVGLSEQLSEQSNNVMDSILQILNEVNQTIQKGESGINTISKITLNMEASYQSPETMLAPLGKLEMMVEKFTKDMEHFSTLVEKSKSCTVQAALEAARLGDEKLTRAAENLNRASEESSLRIEEISRELTDIKSVWHDVSVNLEKHLEQLADGRSAVKEVRGALEEILGSLAQGKEIIENIASGIQRQSTSIEEIKQGQAGIMNDLLTSINKGTGAGNDTKQQMESLHDIDSLAKKLMRMVDRLNVLSMQFKI